jgi:hypothetical protein
VGQLADLALLSADYFTVPEEEIRGIEALLTVMGGKVVHGSADYGNLAPPLPPASPGWSPTGAYGGACRDLYGGQSEGVQAAATATGCGPLPQHTHAVYGDSGNWGIGCTCFVF